MADFPAEGTVSAKSVGSTGHGLAENPISAWLGREDMTPKLAPPFFGSDLPLSLAWLVWCPQLS